jgi:hypothetical protein
MSDFQRAIGFLTPITVVQGAHFGIDKRPQFREIARPLASP